MLKISKQELLSLISELRNLGYEVIAPIRSNVTAKLAPLSSVEDLETDYIRVINSPKDFLLPSKEPLFRYRSTATVTSYGLKIRFQTVEGPCPVTIVPEYTPPKARLAFLCIHPCMANSLKYLDSVMLSEPADPYYKARREDMFVAVLECEEGDEYCLCKTVGTHKVPAGYADLMIRKSGEEFLVRSTSRRGEELLGSLKRTQEPGEPKELVPRLKEEYAFERTDEAGIDERDSSKYVDACTLCSSCTVTCPTCYCSDIEDRFSLMDPSNVERTRVRMSCQRKCYSMIAGGTAFLNTKDARFKWRLKHKFPFSERAYQLVGCIGCGNCIAFCPARIDFRKFLGKRVA